MTTKYILRFDDINEAIDWRRFFKIKEVLEHYSIKSILGVVPECRDDSIKFGDPIPNYFSLIRNFAAYGDAIAQHGTYHKYNTNYSGMLGVNMQSEFAGLSYEDQYKLIAEGREILEAESIWQPYFMAPSHSFDCNTLRALKALNFSAITDGYSLCFGNILVNRFDKRGV